MPLRLDPQGLSRKPPVLENYGHESSRNLRTGIAEAGGRKNQPTFSEGSAMAERLLGDGRTTAKIYAGSGFIWRISVYSC
jgi:hypothetical protein